MSQNESLHSSEGKLQERLSRVERILERLFPGLVSSFLQGVEVAGASMRMQKAKCDGEFFEVTVLVVHGEDVSTHLIRVPFADLCAELQLLKNSAREQFASPEKLS